MSRKRSRQIYDTDEIETTTSDAIGNCIEASKRNKEHDEVYDIELIASETAWHFDVSDLLHTPMMTTHGDPSLRCHSGRGSSSGLMYLLCVLGSMTLQLDLICTIHDRLRNASPDLRIIVLTHDPVFLEEMAPASPGIEFEVIQPKSSHFLKLGLLHPLGGGQQPLDALVLIDHAGLRRLVLPYGWGVGKHITRPEMRTAMQNRYADLFVSSTRRLQEEADHAMEDSNLVRP